MARSLKSVRHLLKDKPTLKFLELEISAQKALLDDVRRLLPGELADHCIAAQKHGDLLTLHADSAVWATRLRFLATQLLILLQPAHPELREIKARLLVSRQPPRRRPRPARRSAAGAEIVRESAADTPQDALRHALERLSETLKRER